METSGSSGNDVLNKKTIKEDIYILTNMNMFCYDSYVNKEFTKI